jgi:tRNA pseudouridine38-40 synthase
MNRIQDLNEYLIRCSKLRKNFKLIIEYDGSCFCGWQRQKKERTIQAEIEKALMTMTAQPIVLTGSGRTDSGVHALGQVANFHCDTDLTADVFQKGLNSLVADDIVIKSCQEVQERFHARYDAKSKTYHYRILNRKIPSAVGRQYAWFIRKKLNIDAMRKASQSIIGTHDFKAFEAAGSPRSTTTRHVIRADFFGDQSDHLIFEIEANGFLRFMVRNIVGTLVQVGLQKVTPAGFKVILLSKDRDQAGMTAPPQGLFLIEVKYE